MEIPPDTKDWTWVLERPCPECGIDTREIRREAIPATIRAVAGDFDSVLSTGDAARARPSPITWSVVEYACHVRDMLRVFDGRLERMLAEDGPRFQNWDQDEAAVAGQYREQDPRAVAGAISEAANRIADRFESVDDDSWARVGTRSDGMRFTVETLGRYLIHDAIHHVHDVKENQGLYGP